MFVCLQTDTKQCCDVTKQEWTFTPLSVDWFIILQEEQSLSRNRDTATKQGYSEIQLLIQVTLIQY